MHRSLFTAFVILTACGGKVDTELDSGPVDADLDSGTDASGDDASCTPIALSNPPPDPGGGCDAVGSWTCGLTKYSVECSCGVMEANPQCSCTTVTGTMSHVTGSSQANCEVCFNLSVDNVAAVCGFP